MTSTLAASSGGRFFMCQLDIYDAPWYIVSNLILKNQMENIMRRVKETVEK